LAIEKAVARWKLVAICVGVAVEYGVIHDFITASICKEYFTQGLRPSLPAHWGSVWLAIYFGVACTWWAGLISGLLLTKFWPKLKMRTLMKLSQGLCLGGLLVASVAGMVGYSLAVKGLFVLPMRIESKISLQVKDLYLAVWAAHLASYGFWSFAIGAICLFHFWSGRRRALASVDSVTGLSPCKQE